MADGARYARLFVSVMIHGYACLKGKDTVRVSMATLTTFARHFSLAVVTVFIKRLFKAGQGKPKPDRILDEFFVGYLQIRRADMAVAAIQVGMRRFLPTLVYGIKVMA